jgi:hypothetical protein
VADIIVHTFKPSLHAVESFGMRSSTMRRQSDFARPAPIAPFQMGPAAP